MDWSPQQEKALSTFEQWYRDFRAGTADRPFFYLAGYAGTGKTTLAEHLASHIEGMVLFGAYTGKAAQVMREKGNPTAQTIHSMLYRWEGDSEDGRPHFRVQDDSPLRGASLVVLDECSMIGEEMARDILSFGAPVLVLGDPAQLPPVGGEGYFTAQDPDVLLTEVHRQALESPIIQFATAARNGERLPREQFEKAQVMPRGDLTPERALQANQVITATNRKRHATNSRVRVLKGYQGLYPLNGERLICLRNDQETGLHNGSQVIVTSDPEYHGDYITYTVKDDQGHQHTVDALAAYFDNPEAVGKMSFYERVNYQEFDYAYAITCHKAQGSQWDDVLVIYENVRKWDQETKQRWMYTAITRAAERLTVAL
jgi:exodeoxyribonuclease-5